MAVEKVSGYVTITSTATEIAAANAARRVFIMEVVNGEVWIGPDNTVAQEDGLRMRETDERLTDSIATTDAWWAIARTGKTATVSFMEVSDV